MRVLDADIHLRRPDHTNPPDLVLCLTRLYAFPCLGASGGPGRSWAVDQPWLEQAGLPETKVKLLEGNRDLVIAHKP